jgi:GNAT superfamily N-acetyltransferase
MNRWAGVVGPPQNDEQTASCFALMAETFVSFASGAEAADPWRRAVETGFLLPGSGPRATFRGDSCVGSYLLEVRQMRLGKATVRSGWVGAVVTQREERHSGIGRALMEDAIAFAKEQRLAVLLLHGLHLFYDQFGYVDVFDTEIHRIRRAQITDLPPSPYRVRIATPDDAKAIVALRDRHCDGYVGPCLRTEEQEAQQIRFADPPPTAAVDDQGEIKGYLSFSWGVLRWFGEEAVADDWAAASALLRHHSGLRGPLQDSADELIWRLPSDSLTFAHISDHLRVQSSTERMPSAGWMACPVDLDALMEAVLSTATDMPLDGPSTVELNVGPWKGTFALDRGRLTATESHAGSETRIVLTPQVLVQLLFGYRRIEWARSRPGQVIPPEAEGILSRFIGAGRGWIPPGDGC